MTMQPALHSFAYSLSYLRDQVAAASDQDMVAQPHGMRNHAAWIIGHITWSCQLLGSVIGLPPWLPENWEQRYGTGSIPVADPSQYETTKDALSRLEDARLRITQAVEQLDAATLDSVFPDPEYHYVFPTIRHAVTQVLVGHTAMHVGQVSVWRNAVGLPSVGRSFE